MDHPRIERDPEIMNGKPVIKGTRMPVEIILERLAYGHPMEELLDDYPFLTQEDIYAALEYALALVQAEAGGRNGAGCPGDSTVWRAVVGSANHHLS